MSTTFGVRIPSIDEIIPVARRMGSTDKMRIRVWFISPLATLLDDDVKVIPMDNSAQGIDTIGQIKNIIKLNE